MCKFVRAVNEKRHPRRKHTRLEASHFSFLFPFCAVLRKAKPNRPRTITIAIRPKCTGRFAPPFPFSGGMYKRCSVIHLYTWILRRSSTWRRIRKHFITDVVVFKSSIKKTSHQSINGSIEFRLFDQQSLIFFFFVKKRRIKINLMCASLLWHVRLLCPLLPLLNRIEAADDENWYSRREVDEDCNDSNCEIKKRDPPCALLSLPWTYQLPRFFYIYTPWQQGQQ